MSGETDEEGKSLEQFFILLLKSLSNEIPRNLYSGYSIISLAFTKFLLIVVFYELIHSLQGRIPKVYINIFYTCIINTWRSLNSNTKCCLNCLLFDELIIILAIYLMGIMAISGLSVCLSVIVLNMRHSAGRNCRFPNRFDLFFIVNFLSTKFEFENFKNLLNMSRLGHHTG